MLQGFSTCDLADAVVKLGHVPKYLESIHLINPGSYNKVHGPAFTVQMVPASDQSSPKWQDGHYVDQSMYTL